MSDISPVWAHALTEAPWSKAERKVLLDHFLAGGAPACAPLLPTRTVPSIYAEAKKLGLRRYERGKRRGVSGRGRQARRDPDLIA